MNESIINYAAIEQAEIQSSPYPFFGLGEAFNQQAHQPLLDSFPTTTAGGSLPLDALPLEGAFAKLIDEIKSDQFRSLMAKKFSVDLDDKPLIITARGFSRAKDGQVHTDSKTKLITILMYLNESWESEAGRLRMLNSDDLEDYAAEFPSAIGQLIAFKVTDNCWHGYHSYEGQRQSIQINYLVEEKYTWHHVYRHKFSAFFKKWFK